MSPSPEQPVPLTELLERARAGDIRANERVFAAVYEDLRRIAGFQRRGGGPTPTLGTTAVVNEAYVRLVGADTPFANRAHFFGVAARAMRSVVVDHARARRSAKRGGEAHREPLDGAVAWFEERSIDVLALDSALDDLERLDPRLRGHVELRFFVGLAVPAVAELQSVSVATAERDWQAARAWLHRRLATAIP